MSGDEVLRLEGLRKVYRQRGQKKLLVAVDDVNLSVGQGECVALVGESGSGKSTLARLALRLIEPDAGRVILLGRDLTACRGRDLREARVAMQPIFQDPTGSFNPRRTVAHALMQAMPRIDDRTARLERAGSLLERVGLRPAGSYLPRLPHELSGGQRQRLAVARAIAMDPAMILADEPLSGADVSIRGQMLNLLTDLRRERGIAYLMITHDISIARAFADRVAVMFGGRIVEEGDPGVVLRSPKNEYTRELVAAVPELRGELARPGYLSAR